MKHRIIAILTLIALVAGLGIFTLSKNAEAAQSSAGSEALVASELFTSRDLEQTPDLTNATYYTLSDGSDIHITTKGVYVFSGSAKNATIYVEAADDDKVQLVLNGASITNTSFPCIYVKSADKVFITTTQDSQLQVTGSFQSDGDTQTDAAIFSKQDITLNGSGKLTISSTYNGIAGKDDVKITGGSYVITATSKAIEANDSIRISDGTLILNCGTDGLHAENADDDSLGYIYIGGGTLSIRAGDDGIRATSLVTIDGGDITIVASEGIEGTYIQINGGVIDIQATDDGINAANKSSAYSTALVINGGSITVVMGSGDTDGIDSNGDIIVNGGSINVSGSSTFDYDGSAQYNGGTIIVNGQQVSYIPNQMMGGMGGFGQKGGQSGWGGQSRGRFGR
ncbi:MAG: carbohydrate-binding domain-containing protein [Clostridia bacterium]|nr:carbohydrate-binding domain-containing protein [Clostridia bacterium]